MERILAQAIRDRRVVEFAYHGEPRQVEPYALGRVGGALTLKGWQSRKGWRTFHVEEMESLEATDRHFDEPREGFVPDPRMSVVASV
jgi:predicted DNA-binding transcriptional regulator YafY